MTDVQLFVAGCVLFSPVLIVLYSTFQEIISGHSNKSINKPVNKYLSQIGFSFLVISVCFLLGIVIFF
ncbi:MAG: hypothetical protein CBD66_005205 [Flavobacteriaceae bacterium TMED206]|nr:MAG: hypothetical protein CBD66_005205 [Flavobacteriaceae bacterium TMED206]|tara:strand:- start:231 stop:434 length:204 start_codon:yes stop_codon:yes gene_type:complete